MIWSTVAAMKKRQYKTKIVLAKGVVKQNLHLIPNTNVINKLSKEAPIYYYYKNVPITNKSMKFFSRLSKILKVYDPSDNVFLSMDNPNPIRSPNNYLHKINLN